jgi:hypothetical protein
MLAQLVLRLLQLQEQRDRVWVISAEAFKDLYEGGKINPGNPPTV